MARRPDRARRRAGFTMLEAVVALAIVGLVCVGVLGAYAGSLRADTAAVDRLPLESLAVERLAAVDIVAGSLAHLPDSVAHGAFNAPYEGARWDVDTRDVREVPGLVEIDVSVHDANESFTLHTRRWRAPVVATGSAIP
jgi:prepilin-type N-terminal cleavage/methylation domain-containing protein